MGSATTIFKQLITASMLMATGHSALAFEASLVTVKVGFGAGGGYDTGARLVANHLGRFLPGNPDMIVQNVAGGGSMRLTQLMLGSEPADGSVIATVASSMVLAPVLNPETVDFDPSDLQWIGALVSDPTLCAVMKDTGIDTLDAFLEREFLVGASGRSSLTYLLSSLVKNGLDANFDIVTGFEGGPDIMLAMQRGEIAGRCGLSPYTIVEANMQDTLEVIGRFGSVAPEGYETLPRFSDFIADPIVKQAAELIETSHDFHVPLLAPAGIPQETLAVLRQAVAEMVEDPEFLAEAERLRVDIRFTSGEEMEAAFAEQLASGAAVFDAARELVK